MAVRYITRSSIQDLTREGLEEDERRIPGAEYNGLGAVRGFVFALLIEAALVLLGGVGWELWRMTQ